MQHLLRKKIITWFCCIGLSQAAKAQFSEMYLPDHDAKPYYFGITLSYNTSHFQASPSPRTLQYDSVLVADTRNGKGFGLGLQATARLNKRFEVRFNPQLIFAQKDIYYRLKYPTPLEDSSQLKMVESTLLSFPIHLKFRSDRIGNFRVYTFAGLKFDYDLASKSSNRRAEDLVKLKKIDYGVEAGMGMNFYFPSFIFSPEIRISNGLSNIHSPEKDNKYSNVINQLQSRMIIFAIHLEG